MGYFPDDDFLLLIRPKSPFFCKLGFPNLYTKGKTDDMDPGCSSKMTPLIAQMAYFLKLRLKVTDNCFEIQTRDDTWTTSRFSTFIFLKSVGIRCCHILPIPLDMRCSLLLLQMRTLLVTSLRIFPQFRLLHSSTQSYSVDISVS